MKEEIQYCECCGAKLTGRWESLTAGLVDTLILFARNVQLRNRNKIHLQNDLNLTKNQYNNFQKLRYFGLVAKVKDEEKLKSGHWALTRKAGDFLQGKPILKKVFIFRNHIKKRGEEFITISDKKVLGQIPYWLKAEDFDYETASEFVGDFTEDGQGKLF